MSTFGTSTAAGGGTDNPSINTIWVKATSAPVSSGTLSAIHVWCKRLTAAPVLAVALYADSAGSPGARLAQNIVGASVTSTTLGDVSVPLSVAITSGTQYWFALLVLVNGLDDISVDFGTAAGTEVYYKSTGGTFPDPLTAPDGSDASERWTVWGEYTAGGGGGATNQDTGPSPSRNRPGRGPYSRGRFYISTPADVFSSPRYTTVVSAGGLQFGGAGVNARVRTLAAAGGLQFGGAASFAKGKTIVPVGGLAFAGTSVMARARAIAASGGIIFSGSAGFATGGSNSFSYTAAGGLTYAGSAPRSRAKVVAPAGGVVFGGTAGFATGGNQQFSYTASGGMLLAGAALKARARAVQAVGGALFGGGAGIAYHQSTRIVVPAGGIIFGGAALVFVPGSSTMSLPTIYLADASAVPVTAVFRSGAAYAQTGERYVASWPSNAKVHYISGVAHRDDGAMCIDPAGVEFLDLRGVSITARGEIIVTLSAPDLVHDALPLTLNGLLCVTDLN